MGRVYAVASAKGGVGKTTTTANLGTALAAAGHTVVVVDADVAMPNLGRMLGVSPDGPSLHDVLAEDADPLDAVYDGPDGVAVVPGTRTLEDYVKANPRKLGAVLDALDDDYDIVLVDTGAGLSHDTLLPLGLADRVILVSTPSPDALGDTTKTAELAERIGAAVAGIVLTRVDSDRVDVDALVDSLDFPLMALVPEDPTVEDASADAASVTTVDPDSPAAAAYRALADAVVADTMQESFEAPVTDEPGEADDSETPEASEASDDAEDAEDAGDTEVTDDAEEAEDSDDAEDAEDVDTDQPSEIDLSSVLDSDSDDDSDLDEILSIDDDEPDEALEDEPETTANASDDPETELDEELEQAFDPDGTEDADDSQEGGGIASALAEAEVETDSDADADSAEAAEDEPVIADAVAEAETETEEGDVTFETAPEESTSDVTVQPAEIPDAEDAADSESDSNSAADSASTSSSESGADDEDDENEDDGEKSGKKGLFGRFFG